MGRDMDIHRHSLLLLCATLALLLVSCASQGPVPEDRFYRLPVPPAQQEAIPALAAVLGVGRLRSDGLRDERAILYLHSERPLELRRYHYHHWVDAPTRMLQEHMIAYLRQAHGAAEVLRYTPGMQVDKVVGGRLLRFERVLGAGAGTVVVEMELGLGDGRYPQQGLRVYRAEVEAGADSMHATVQAFGLALQQIYRQFLQQVP